MVKVTGVGFDLHSWFYLKQWLLPRVAGGVALCWVRWFCCDLCMVPVGSFPVLSLGVSGSCSSVFQTLIFHTNASGQSSAFKQHVFTWHFVPWKFLFNPFPPAGAVWCCSFLVILMIFRSLLFWPLASFCFFDIGSFIFLTSYTHACPEAWPAHLGCRSTQEPLTNEGLHFCRLFWNLN